MTGRTVAVGDVVVVAFGIWPLRVTAQVQILGEKKRHWKQGLLSRRGKLSRRETYRAYMLSDNDGHFRNKKRFVNIRQSQIMHVVRKADASPSNGNIVYLTEATTGAA